MPARNCFILKASRSWRARLMKSGKSVLLLAVILECALCVIGDSGPRPAVVNPQRDGSKKKTVGPPKPMTIPVGIKIRGRQPETELRPLDLNVTEDGDPQAILSIRAYANSPITLAV